MVTWSPVHTCSFIYTQGTHIVTRHVLNIYLLFLCFSNRWLFEFKDVCVYTHGMCNVHTHARDRVCRSGLLTATSSSNLSATSYPWSVGSYCFVHVHLSLYTYVQICIRTYIQYLNDNV